MRLLLIQLQGLDVTALQGPGHAKLKRAPEAEAAQTDALQNVERLAWPAYMYMRTAHAVRWFRKFLRFPTSSAF